MKVRFRKEINPFQVSDKAVFRNVDKTLVLYVRSDAAPLMVGLKKAQEKLSNVTAGSTAEEQAEAARYFAQAIFGEEQAGQLADFYKDPITLISACGMYFDRQLKYKIVAAQKKK